MVAGVNNPPESLGGSNRPGASGHSMSLIPYKKGDLFSINVLFWCDTLECYTAFMACPACHRYPCDRLTAQDVNMLKTSPLMRIVSVALLSRRIKKMYIAKKNDGKLEVIRNLDEKKPDLRNLDEKKPDPNQLRNVEEIYVVGKVLVPVLSLKPKPKQERDKLMKARRVEKPIADSPAVNKVSELRRKSK
jgi:hypothetical protein